MSFWERMKCWLGFHRWNDKHSVTRICLRCGRIEDMD